VVGVSRHIAGALLAPLWRVSLLDRVSALAAQPRGGVVAAASLGGTVELISLESGRVMARLPSHPGGALSLAWSPDGRTLASGGQDGKVRLATANGATIALLDVGKSCVEHLAWNGDGKVLASASGHTVHFWSRTGESLGEVAGHASTVTALAAQPRAVGFLSACFGGLQFLTVGQPEPTRQLAWKGSVLCLAVTHDAKWFVVGGEDATMHIWREGGKRFHMLGYPAAITGIGFSADGQWLWSHAGHAVVVWPFSGKGPAGRIPIQLRGHAGAVTTAAWVPGRSVATLVSGAADGTIRVWRLPDGTPFGLGEVGEPVEKVALSADGRCAVAGGRSGIVTGWGLG
jgi:WD40 repeat protein